MQTFIIRNEFLHLVGITRHDHDQILPMIFHVLYKRIDCFMSEVSLTAVGQRICLVDEQHAAFCLLQFCHCLRSRLPHIRGHQLVTAAFHQMPAGQNSQTAIDLADQSGNGSLTGSGFSGKDHVKALSNGRQSVLHPLLIELLSGDQTVHLILYRLQTYQRVQFPKQFLQTSTGLHFGKLHCDPVHCPVCFLFLWIRRLLIVFQSKNTVDLLRRLPGQQTVPVTLPGILLIHKPDQSVTDFRHGLKAHVSAAGIGFGQKGIVGNQFLQFCIVQLDLVSRFRSHNSKVTKQISHLILTGLTDLDTADRIQRAIGQHKFALQSIGSEFTYQHSLILACLRKKHQADISLAVFLPDIQNVVPQI